MNNDTDKEPPQIATDPNFGGASAGAQDGGIVDAGAADNETTYEVTLAGRKGGMVRNDASSGYVDTSEYDAVDQGTPGAPVTRRP